MKKIVVVDGDNEHKEIVGSQDGYKSLLARLGVAFIVDQKDFNTNDFESLVDGGRYTLGPQMPQQQTVGGSPMKKIRAASALEASQQLERERLERLLETTAFNRSSIHRYEKFEFDGFGPYVVKRKSLTDGIIQEASPQRSVHICGCKGAGKTSLLRLIGMQLANNSKVYYFKAATGLNHYDWTAIVGKLILEKRKAYFLVDETQTVAALVPEALVLLLKNESGHELTVIGAGVPEFQTMSASFVVKHTTDDLFLSNEALRGEGIIDYFDGTPKAAAILEHVRDHCGGHIYPLLRGMELLKSESDYERLTPEQVIAYYESPGFRRSSGYKDICTRVLPPVRAEEIRPLFYPTTQFRTLEFEALRKKGFVSAMGKVLSRLLLDAYILSIGSSDNPITNLLGGLDGIQQVLRHSLPRIQWSQYDPFGGPIEDALSFELLSSMAHTPQLTTRLFNPKLVDVGTSGRRPDIYINSEVNSFIECLLTEGHTVADKESLEEHIDRFCAQDDDDSEVRYRLLDTQDYAVLNFQKTGTTPLNPSDEFRTLFEERVFTFLMASRNIFRGNVQLIGFREPEVDRGPR